MAQNIKIVNKMLPQARLPFSRIKGDNVQRNIISDEYNKFFYKYLNKRCHKRKCSLKDFRNALDKTLYPNSINYHIEKEISNQNNGSFGIIPKLAPGENGEIIVYNSGYCFLLPLNNREDTILSKYTAFHEARHFFDNLCNPKYSKLHCKNLINDKHYDKTADKIRSLFFDKMDTKLRIKKFKTNTENLILTLPNNIAIELLQSIRYRLQTEINAYRDEVKYMIRDGNFVSGFNLALFLNQNCKFKSKLKFAENMLKDIITKEREILKNRNSSRETPQNP